MACRDAVRSDLRGLVDKVVELYEVVAEDTGAGRFAAQVGVDERADHRLLELVLEIEDVEGETDVSGDATRVPKVVERAAPSVAPDPVVRFGVGFGPWRPALVPQLHRQPDDRVALLLEEDGGGRRIDPAAHCNGDHGCGCEVLSCWRLAISF